MNFIILFILILVIIFCIINYTSNPLTNNIFLLVNYMYILLALLIFILINNIITNPETIVKLNSRILPLFILTIMSIFGLLLCPSEYQTIKHIVWTGLIILLSIMLQPIYTIAKQQNILSKVIISEGAIIATMSYIAYSNQLDYFNGLFPYLFIGLFGLIIFESFDLLFADYTSPNINTRFWYYSIFGILLFSGFLVYDTQKLIKTGQSLEIECYDKNHLVCADYPSKTLDIILDMINLFSNITSVYR
jgi:FtsH-binding integral membrane protein